GGGVEPVGLAGVRRVAGAVGGVAVLVGVDVVAARDGEGRGAGVMPAARRGGGVVGGRDEGARAVVRRLQRHGPDVVGAGGAGAGGRARGERGDGDRKSVV